MSEPHLPFINLGNFLLLQIRFNIIIVLLNHGLLCYGKLAIAASSVHPCDQNITTTARGATASGAKDEQDSGERQWNVTERRRHGY